MIIFGVIVLEGIILYLGQRKIFGNIYQRFGKLMAYFLAAPGTILHELSHYLMCKILRVRTGRVSLFKPIQQEDGSIILGTVEHERSDPLRGALVAIAPAIFVPAFVVLIVSLIVQTNILTHPTALTDLLWWQIPALLYIVISSGQGAFPSSGDHVGFFGFIALGLLATAIYFVVPEKHLIMISQYAAIMLAIPALTAVISLVLLNNGNSARKE